MDAARAVEWVTSFSMSAVDSVARAHVPFSSRHGGMTLVVEIDASAGSDVRQQLTPEAVISTCCRSVEVP